jgi:hypothetical protein
MGMGMGAGFGMMMPAMIQQAMLAQRGGAVPPVASVAPAVVAARPAVADGLDFGNLAPQAVDPKQLVRSVAQAAGWQVQEAGDVWQITLPVGSLRKQTVAVNFATQDEDGDRMIAFSSICGPASDRNAMALLRYNAQMVHGAFAVQKTGAGEMIVVQANQLAATADPLGINRVISAIAWQADKAEEKLGGSDQY